jgi:hypothetical protein
MDWNPNNAKIQGDAFVIRNGKTARGFWGLRVRNVKDKLNGHCFEKSNIIY